MQVAIDLARSAGQRTLDFFQGSVEVQIKSDRSEVTEADHAAHRIIEQGLAETGIPVVSEEGSHHAGAERFWCVDPLDGTKSFIAGSPEYTVNIALIEQGRPVWGVVYAPAQERLWFGGAGQGAWMQSQGGEQPIGVSATGSPLRVLATRNHSNPQTEAFLADLGPIEHLARGSSLKFCAIAQGEADLYPRLGPCCEWDTAAGEAILIGAGGAVCDFDGQPLRYGKPDVLNPWFIASGQASPSDYLPKRQHQQD